MSKDADFPELISRLGAPPKLINLRIGNCDNRFLWEKLKVRIHEMIAILTTDSIDIIELELER
ncbi:DUF5615 family PIN-like protein [Niabella ginsenosidivorans]|uniref:DUF5615 family PIN-like protein n=1 Tax=Niabella ginsenosidivorans TaxID=1176587 RepID=UPI00373FDFFC